MITVDIIQMENATVWIGSYLKNLIFWDTWTVQGISFIRSFGNR